MNNVNKIYEDLILSTIKPFEDYSDKLVKTENQIKYADGYNNCIISEDSLSRTLSVMQDKDFAILTAYRSNFSKVENIVRNRKLRTILNNHKMGVHQLVGHWQEAPVGKDYTECEPNELTDVVERSYLVSKPESMSVKEFEQLILDLLTIDGETQDAAIIKNENGIFLLYNNGVKEQIGSECTLGKINQAYSQHIKNNMPFVFEGIEIPASNISKQMYQKNNILF